MIDNEGVRDVEGSVRKHERGYAGLSLAALAAAVLLAGTGVGFRSLGHYLGATDQIPLPIGTLSRIPLQVGQWEGQDVAMDEAIRRATDTDDLVNRHYTRDGGRELVALYVACGVKARDLMPHRPEVCYPGAGWMLSSSDDLELALADGSALACRLLRFSKGGFDLRQIAVVNYYIVDGQYCPDVSLLRSKSWWGSRGVGYMVQVQITCWADGLRDLEAAEASARAFATESAEAIASILPAVDMSPVSEDEGPTYPDGGGLP